MEKEELVGLEGAGIREMISVHRTLLPPPRVDSTFSYHCYGAGGSRKGGNEVTDLDVMPGGQVCSDHWTIISVAL